MKKLISTILVGTMMIGLCACGSKNEVTTQPSITDKQIEFDEPKQDPTLVDTTNPTQETEAQHQVYSLEGMSTDEICTLIINLSTNLHTGDTKEKIEEQFDVSPTSEDYLSYSFWYLEDSPNCITSVYYDVQKEMDNTLTITPTSFVRVSLTLKDYDTASAIYSQLFDYMCQNIPNQTGTINDNREGTSWNSQVYCIVTIEENDYTYDYGYDFGISLSLNEYTNDYRLTVNLPIS